MFAGWLSAPSRIGEVFVAFTGDGVQFVRPAESVRDDPEAFAAAYRRRFARPLRAADRAPAGLLPALRGRRASALQLDLGGLSDFERAVLAATRWIPAGETRPYGWVAREVGRPRAVRAAAWVLARNPVPLLVPCHRVVRADGRLGEYMFGPAHKERLLRAEHADLDAVAELRPARRALPGQRQHRHRLFPDLPQRSPDHPGPPARVPQRRAGAGCGLPPVPQLPAGRRERPNRRTP